jgi:DNA-binding NtrC family response regulator
MKKNYFIPWHASCLIICNKKLNKEFMKKDQTYNSQIMIIDNDKFVRESLSTFFCKGPLRLLIFKSAVEGLNALKHQDIDVVVSDYFLPDMDGLSFLKQVGRQNPGIARVLMSTIVSDNLKTETITAGIDTLLEKPLSVASIDQVLCNLTKKHSSRIDIGDN